MITYKNCFPQEDTISINHNWLNGCNIDIMWQFLQNELSSVQKEIDEWRNTMDSWHQHCQVLFSFLLRRSDNFKSLVLLFLGHNESMLWHRLHGICLFFENHC